MKKSELLAHIWQMIFTAPEYAHISEKTQAWERFKQEALGRSYDDSFLTIAQLHAICAYALHSPLWEVYTSDDVRARKRGEIRESTILAAPDRISAKRMYQKKHTRLLLKHIRARPLKEDQ